MDFVTRVSEVSEKLEIKRFFEGDPDARRQHGAQARFTRGMISMIGTAKYGRFHLKTPATPHDLLDKSALWSLHGSNGLIQSF